MAQVNERPHVARTVINAGWGKVSRLNAIGRVLHPLAGLEPRCMRSGSWPWVSTSHSATAQEGFEHACRLTPDGIVADVSAAGESGLDLTRRLRREARTRSARIIVLTSATLGGIKDKAEARVAIAFL